MRAGFEWLIDAAHCNPERLREPKLLARLFDDIVHDLSLHPVAPPVWHVFPGPGGITGMVVLSESHLACHTFPEYGLATFNLYCCRERPAWPWTERLREALEAERISVRVVRRGTTAFRSRKAEAARQRALAKS